MKSRIGEINNLLKIIPIILLVSNILFSFLLMEDTNIAIASDDNLEWSVTLNIFELGDTNNILVFGEASDASDGQDAYDVPIPPPGIAPYIRPWFDAGLSEPYNSLFYDIRNYSDLSKTWDLYIQWVPSDYTSPNEITISWDDNEVSSSKYESVILYDFENDRIVADMLITSSYSYESSAMEQYHFQIICSSTEEPDIPPNKNLYPTAILKGPKKGYVNQSISFDASDSNDSDVYVQYYRWDFTNDGTFDTDWIGEAFITNIYTYSGNYSVKLQIKDNGGLIDSTIFLVPSTLT